MRHGFILLMLAFFLLSGSNALAQTTEELSDGYVTEQDDDRPKLITDEPQLKRIELGVTAGTSIGTTFGSSRSTFASTFVAPQLTYHVNPRSRVSGGMMLRMNRLDNSWAIRDTEGTTYTFYRPEMQTSVFVKGAYDLTEKFTVTGTAFYDIAQFDLPKSQSINYSSYGFSVGGEYKVNEKTRIGAEIQFSRGRNPYNPYSNGLNSLRPGGSGSFGGYSPIW